MYLASVVRPAEVLFCGHYVLAVCTDETSALMRPTWFPMAFTIAVGGDETAFVKQIVAPRMVALAYAKVSHSGDGFEELSVNNSFIFLSHAVALYRL